MQGKSDGVFAKKRYFQCPDGHGLFATIDKVKIIDKTTIRDKATITLAPTGASVVKKSPGVSLALL